MKKITLGSRDGNVEGRSVGENGEADGMTVTGPAVGSFVGNIMGGKDGSVEGKIIGHILKIHNLNK